MELDHASCPLPPVYIGCTLLPPTDLTMAQFTIILPVRHPPLLDTVVPFVFVFLSFLCLTCVPQPWWWMSPCCCQPSGLRAAGCLLQLSRSATTPPVPQWLSVLWLQHNLISSSCIIRVWTQNEPVETFVFSVPAAVRGAEPAENAHIG